MSTTSVAFRCIKETCAREEAYRNLSAKLRGSVITPGNGEYEVARRVYNGMIDRRDRRPDAIAPRPGDEDRRVFVAGRTRRRAVGNAAGTAIGLQIRRPRPDTGKATPRSDP
jgi:hypothetical protein